MPETGKKSILFLQHADEMRHPYATAFADLCGEIHWVSELVELLAYQSGNLGAVIVDLDCLNPPFGGQLQQIRAQFPSVDLIAISSEDSSKLALECIRSGFTDYMLKPVSPEELSWCIRKCYQRQDLIERMEPQDPRAGFVRAISQISSATTGALVRLYALEYLNELIPCSGAAWLHGSTEEIEKTEVVCSIPKDTTMKTILSHFPKSGFPKSLEQALVNSEKGKVGTYIILPTRNYPKNFIYCWGLGKKPIAKTLSLASLLLEHAELSLLNINKFDELKQQTFIDDLTGLYNSRFLKFAVTNSIMKCKSPKQSFSILFIDVDHFKSINDKYGHVIGSEFLVAIGRTIRNAVRGIDPAFRYGGDEFVVILNNTGTDGAREVAERIRKNIERRVFVIQGEKLRTTVSIGVATYPEHASERETLLRLADEAMYGAKKSSRNAVHLAIGLEHKKGA